ncbi:MAG: glutamate--tRNA ligase [Candidatus Omnitrophota bacterium]
MIRTRFAPSPTGYLHIGGARTALFSWMYARSQSGQFVLRIEDTDLARSQKEYLDDILESMTWLGLSWDELYHQSERFDIYKEHAQKLLKEDKAYQEGEAILLKISGNPATGGIAETSSSAGLRVIKKADDGPQHIVKFFDLIHGEIHFDTATLKDEVLIKSDGSPTYSFACVVDDALMDISHVIRGDDHISNTPKQIMMYEALGFKIPKFAHLPLIMGDDGGRLSKRTGAVALTDYRAMGFVSKAVVNYLMLLGWSPGNNQEIIELSSAVKKFSIKKLNKAKAAFSLDKLKWVNAQHIKQMAAQDLTDLLIPFLKEKNYIGDDFDRKRLESIVKLFQSRMDTLLDFLERADFAFVDDYAVNQEAKAKYLSQDRSQEFALLSKRLKDLKEFNGASTERAFRELVEELNLQAAELVHPVRVALCGKDVGPGLFETMAIIGKEKTIERLNKAF